MLLSLLLYDQFEIIKIQKAIQMLSTCHTFFEIIKIEKAIQMLNTRHTFNSTQGSDSIRPI